MLKDVTILLSTLVQYSPQLFLTGVTKKKHLHSLFKLLTITNHYSNDQIGNLMFMCGSVVCVCIKLCCVCSLQGVVTIV